MESATLQGWNCLKVLKCSKIKQQLTVAYFCECAKVTELFNRRTLRYVKFTGVNVWKVGRKVCDTIYKYSTRKDTTTHKDCIHFPGDFTVWEILS